jgi:hypothetical protein
MVTWDVDVWSVTTVQTDHHSTHQQANWTMRNMERSERRQIQATISAFVWGIGENHENS